jgi:ribosomal protein S18 acetylase RimI-like enzyme
MNVVGTLTSIPVLQLLFHTLFHFCPFFWHQPVDPATDIELGTVADIIMDSFYSPKTSWRGLYRVAELNRVQQNFPYVNTDLHQMLVAVATDTQGVLPPKIVGFCDVDCRPCKTIPRLPRPYLSDLTVALDFRRRGIARSMVEYCETFVRECTAAANELYIRVEATNEPAVSMYRGMGYATIRQETQRLDYKNGAEVTVLVLQKKLDIEDDNEDTAEPVVTQTVAVVDNDNVDPSSLDFVV